MSDIETGIVRDDDVALPDSDAPKTDLRDALSRKFDEIQARDSDDAPRETAEPAPAPAAQGQPRSADGKFANKPSGSAGQQSADQPATGAAEPGAAAAAPAIEAPQSWSAEAKALWGQLSPEAQRYIAQREGEVHKHISSAGERLKAYDAIEQVLGPRRGPLSASFGSEAAALQTLFATSDWAGKDPVGFVRWFAENRGIDLRSLIQQPPAGSQPAPQMDPQLAALDKRLGNVTAWVAQQEKAQADAEYAAINRELEAFARDKPHFEAVRDAMGVIIDRYPETTLDDAYDMACHALPTTRKALAEAQEAARKAEADKAAADARTATDAEATARVRTATRNQRLNVTSRGVGVSPAKPKDLRETIERNYEAILARSA